MKLTVVEAASLLDAPEERVYDWIEDAKLPAQRVRGQYRINPTELLEWATERGLRVAPRLFAEREGRETPPIADALRAGGIHYEVHGDEVVGAVRGIIAGLPIADDDRETLLHIVVARQDLGLTVVHDRIAIPQVRTPAVLATESSALTLSFLAPPLGKRHIDTIFFLISPTVHAHLMMLSKLTACLSDEGVLSALERRAPAEEIMRAASVAEEALR